ncbi:MAG TPA: hypothetical protein VFB06_31400 [Streptosporangiaceae bacterium]|nr:hypothetical protein [Streptosporangiaceae bacterium]
MSYDPLRYPGNRTLTPPNGTPSSVGGPPWAIQSYQEQPGYGDAFDGAQAYAGAQNYAGYDGYPPQEGYADPFAGHAGPQDGYAPAQYGQAEYGQAEYGQQPQDAQQPYGQQPRYGQGQYEEGQYGPGQYGQPQYGQAEYGQAEYGAPAGYQNYQGHQGYQGYPDERPSGPMLAAPDETRWDGFGADLDEPATDDDSPGMIAGGVMGVVAAGAAIGIATLVAAFFRPQASPIIAVGEWFIDHTPSWLKNFAVEKFGEHDKTMLLLGMYVTITLLAVGIGVMARRRTTIGIVGVAVFGLFGAYIAYTRPDSKFSDVIPSVIGGIAGVAALLWLAHAAASEPTRPVSRGSRTGRTGRHGGTHAAGGWA